MDRQDYNQLPTADQGSYFILIPDAQQQQEAKKKKKKDDKKGKYIAFCLALVIIVLVVAIVGLTKSALVDPGKWDSYYNGTDTNGTMQTGGGGGHAMAAIGHLAANLDTAAVDKSGRAKAKWGASAG